MSFARRALPLTLLVALVALGASPVSANGPDEPAPAENLLAVFDQARHADPTLRGQHFELEHLRERRREDLSRLMPHVTLSGDIRRTRRDQTQSGMAGEQETTRDFTMRRYGVDLRQPLVDLPAWHGLARGDREVSRGEAELEVARQELVARVTEAYLQVLGAQSGVELAQQELRAIQANEERVSGLFEERMVARVDVEEVRARRDSAQAALIRAEGELDVALERLTEITNVPHQRLAALREDATLPTPDPDNLDAWVEQALAANPHIRAARQRVEAAEADIRGARAGRYPSVDLVASYSYLDDLDGTAFGRKYEDAAIGLQMDVPLYTGGGVTARSRGAVHTRDRERTALEATRRGVRADVRAAWRSVLSSRSEIAALEQAVRSNERSVEAVDAGFGAGLRPLSDVLDTQRDLFAARRDLAQARHEYLIHFIELRRAAGALYEGDIVALNDMLTHAGGSAAR
ncbi:type I secretion protein TolC [Ectothiorhodospira haloalkaliphila]|uniref:Type I secretion protein TolC n=3 Tax=Ectothiorhodospira haloalkaliphila TaxID=421628 RepID=W8KIW9_9GAMM|nr:TolC family outer membrane protein [Ectothiorhodospira haloalkaliphila]AHK79709.1 type I secretion protein TolC [Ectothiorhodospira haloalkaliphila]